jgi:glycogen operon protein
MLELRRRHYVFHRQRFFVGRIIPGTEARDVTWLRPDGEEMTEPDWHQPHARALGMLLSGEAGVMHVTDRGEPEPDDTFLLVMNAAAETVPFTLPPAHWWCVFDTTADDTEPSVDPEEDTDLGRLDRYDVGPRSLVLLRRNGGGEA